MHFRQLLLISINKQTDAILQPSVYDSHILCQCSKLTFINSFGCITLDIPLWVEMTEQIDWRGTVISGLRFRKSEVLRCLRFYLLAQTHGHHTVDRLGGRSAERRSARQSPFKRRERTIVNQTNSGTGSMATLGTWWSTYGLFRVHRCHFELKWTELSPATAIGIWKLSANANVFVGAYAQMAVIKFV